MKNVKGSGVYLESANLYRSCNEMHKSMQSKLGLGRTTQDITVFMQTAHTQYIQPLNERVADILLEFANLQDDMTTSDLQGCSNTQARDLIILVANEKQIKVPDDVLAGLTRDKYLLINQIAEIMLKFSYLRDEMTTSDYQGYATAQGQRIIDMITKEKSK